MPRNEAGARQAKSIYGTTLNVGNDDDTQGDETVVGQRRKCEVLNGGVFKQYLSPLWAHQALWLSERLR